MRSKTALRKVIRKLIMAGRWTEAERLLRTMEQEVTTYEEQSTIRRVDRERFSEGKVISLDEYKRLRDDM